MMVAPSAEVKERLRGWDVAETDKLIEAFKTAQSQQWVPPPPDPKDVQVGEAGYSLQIGLPRLQDALDSISQDSDRFSLIIDLGGMVTTFFQYRDVNMACYAKPSDIEPEMLRKKILGALRYGKPFVLDTMSVHLERSEIEALFEAVLPGLLKTMLSKAIAKEENYSKLIRDDDDDDYKLIQGGWKEATTAHFHFVLLTKLPIPPDWCIESFFVLKVAGG